jgi:hypothetical protein
MKKIIFFVLAVFVISLVPPSTAAAEDKNALQAIKHAVKKNPHYQEGREIMWFKLLVIDENTKETKVKLNLPIAVVEMFLMACDDDDLEIEDDLGRELDIKKMFLELKKAGPAALLEVRDNGEVVKIWLE